MKKIISWLWGFVPASAQVWVVGGAVAAVVAGIYFLFQSIEQRGYNRCQTEHDRAAAEAKETARARIVPVGRKYDEIKRDIAKQPQLHDPVGRLVAGAVDRVPSGPAGK